jgi:hypothetical protein
LILVLAPVKRIPEAHELIGLFETEPTLLDAGVPWVYNRVTFTTTRQNVTVTVAVESASRVVDVALSVDGEPLSTFALREVESLDLERHKGTEGLRVEFRSPAVEPFLLWLKPRVSVHWGSTSVSSRG